jgi:lactoylglutathione lyase
MGFCWVTVNVKDMEESLRFYQDIIGLPLNRRMRPMPKTELAFLGSGGTEVELIQNSDKADFSYGRDISIGFTVESLDKTMEFLKGKGIKSIAGPYQPNPLLRFIYIDDPNGVKIQLIENIRR